MTLDEFFNTPDAPSMAEFAKAIGVRHADQVRQWRHGYSGRKPSPKLCVAIERATGGGSVLDSDPRLAKLREAFNVLLAGKENRAEKVQMIFSDKTPGPK